MTKKKEISGIKEDINFLENPGFTLNSNSKETRIIIKKENGTYELSGAKGIPNAFDQRVMVFVINKFFIERQGESLDLITTRYEIAKKVFRNNKISGENNFNRILVALEKWVGVVISFKGIFYTGDNYTTRYFSKIDDVIFNEDTKKLYIRINQQYFKHLQETKYYKMINLDMYMDLRKPSSLRLYEILSKTFLDRDSWIINLESLAEKMAAEKRSGVKNYYPSDILQIIKPAVEEINQRTNLHIQFDYFKKNQVCSFKKIKKLKESKIIPAKKANASIIENKLLKTTANVKKCMDYFQTLPADQKVKILEGIERNPIFKSGKDLSYQINAYMEYHKLWQPAAE